MSVHWANADQTIRRTTSLGIGAYPFTLMAWIKTDETPSTTDAVVWLGSRVATNRMYHIGTDSNNKAYVGAQNTTEARAPSTTTVVGDGRWHWIAGVFIGNTNKQLYVDGVLEATLTTNIAFSTSTNGCDIGRRGDSSPSNFYGGTAAHVHVWEGSLTQQELIQAAALPGSVRHTRSTLLQAYLPLTPEAPTMSYNDDVDLWVTSGAALAMIHEGPPIHGLYWPQAQPARSY